LKKTLIINFNEDLNKYNKSLTQQKRKIDLKMFYNFLIYYNFNINASYCTTNILYIIITTQMIYHIKLLIKKEIMLILMYLMI
jgi:hypothetical protein